MVKDIELRQAEGEEAPAIAKVERAEVNADWGTAFEDVFSLSHVTIYGLEANINLNEPMKVLYCLSNARCSPRASGGGLRARLKEQAKTPLADAKEAEGRKPLLLEIGSFSVESGSIQLERNQQKLSLELSKGTGENVFVPLRLEPGSLELDVFVRSAEERVPVRLRLNWAPEAGEQTLEVVLFSKELPLNTLTPLFPELFGELSAVSGKLSGKTVLRYSKSKGWKLGA